MASANMTKDERNQRKLATNTQLYLAATILGSLFSIFTVPILTRHLSAQEFGLYIILVQVVMTVQSVGLIFFSQSLLRFHLEWEGEARQSFFGTLLISVLSLEIFLGSTLYFWREDFLLIVYPNIDLPLDPYVGLACGWLLLASFRSLSSTKIRASEKPLLELVMNLCYGLFLSLSIWIFVFKMKGGLAGALISFIIAEACSIICVGPIIWRGVRWCWRPKMLISAVKFSLPLAVSSLLFVLSVNMDRKVLSEYVSLKEIGIYGVGFLIGNTIGLMVSSYAAAFTPHGLKVWKTGGRTDLEEIVKVGLADSLRLALSALAGVIIFGSYAAKLLGGENMCGPAAFVAVGVGLGHVIRLLFTHAQTVLFIGGQTGKVLLLNACLLLATWFIAHGLTQVGGLVGVSLTMTCAYLLFLPLAFSLTKCICTICLPWKTIMPLLLGLCVIAGLEFFVSRIDHKTFPFSLGYWFLQFCILFSFLWISLPIKARLRIRDIWGFLRTQN